MKLHGEIVAGVGFHRQRNRTAGRNKRMRLLIVEQGRETAHRQILSRSRPAFHAEHWPL